MESYFEVLSNELIQKISLYLAYNDILKLRLIDDKITNYNLLLSNWKYHEYVYSIILKNRYSDDFLDDFNEADIITTTYDMDEMYLVARVKGIDVSKTPFEVQQHLLLQMPSLDWMITNMRILATLPKESVNLIYEYTGADYTSINAMLRNNPTSKAPLNDIIALTDPIDKDIIVYRFVLDPTFITSDFHSYGYLSTSTDPFIYIRLEEKVPVPIYMMKIHVPKGSKAIRIPIRTDELIFQHNIRLTLKRVYNDNFLSYNNEVVSAVFYELQLHL